MQKSFYYHFFYYSSDRFLQGDENSLSIELGESSEQNEFAQEQMIGTFVIEGEDTNKTQGQLNKIKGFIESIRCKYIEEKIKDFTLYIFCEIFYGKMILKILGTDEKTFKDKGKHHKPEDGLFAKITSAVEISKENIKGFIDEQKEKASKFISGKTDLEEGKKRQLESSSNILLKILQSILTIAAVILGPLSIPLITIAATLSYVPGIVLSGSIYPLLPAAMIDKLKSSTDVVTGIRDQFRNEVDSNLYLTNTLQDTDQQSRMRISVLGQQYQCQQHLGRDSFKGASDSEFVENFIRESAKAKLSTNLTQKLRANKHEGALPDETYNTEQESNYIEESIITSSSSGSSRSSNSRESIDSGGSDISRW